MTRVGPPRRRRPCRGGAGGARARRRAWTVGTAPTRALAADGEAILQGQANQGTLTTTVEVTASTASPALQLVNSGGPALRLQPITGDSWKNLQAGELAASDNQLYVGFGTEEANRFGVPVATWLDLDLLPLPSPEGPTRLLDTRSTDRARVVDQSADAFDSRRRLKANRYLDIGVATINDSDLYVAAFINVTVTQTAGAGFVAMVAGGAPLSGSTVNFVANQTIANSAFVGVGAVGGWFAVRVWAAQTTHVIIDLTGSVASSGLRRTSMGARTPRQSEARTAKARKLLARRARG